MCSALGARRLLLRAETDSDVVRLRARRRTQTYATPDVLVECCRALGDGAIRERNTLQRNCPELPELRWESHSLKETIKALPRPTCKEELDMLWSLMVCFASRRLVDFVEATDADRFGGFLDSAASNLKLRETFQKSEELRHVLQRKAELVAAVAELSSSKDAVLSEALARAVQDGLLNGAGGEVRHGIVAVRSDTKAKELLGVVEAALVGTDVAVHVAEEKQVASAAIELLKSAEGRGRGGVLIVSHEKLLRLDHEARSSGQERPHEGVPWSILSLLIDYDALPEPLLMQARLEPRVSIVTLELRIQSTISAAEAEKAPDKQPHASALDSFIFSFRQAHGASHEAAIETSALLGASKPSLRRAHAPSDGAALSVMVGEDLLINGRRLVGVLRRQGVKLLETSMELPHLILDHESGLLACDVATVRHPADVEQMVRRCELAFRKVWLLLLYRSSSSPCMRDLWASARSIAAATSASPLQVTVRVVPWEAAWDFLQPLLQHATASSGAADSAPHDDAEEESQHEAFLVRSSLNSAAARRVVRGHSLKDVLSLQRRLRMAHMSWIPERAALLLDKVAEPPEPEG